MAADFSAPHAGARFQPASRCDADWADWLRKRRTRRNATRTRTNNPRRDPTTAPTMTGVLLVAAARLNLG
jgi:hypothetical protein